MISANKLGREIARSVALAGYATVVEDVIPSVLRNAEVEIRANLRADRRRESSVDAITGLGPIKFAGSLEEAAREADLVIEAVPDELESKLEIFTLLDRICRPGTILVSTASQLSITDIASVTLRKSKCAGMRFLDLSGPKSVELVRTVETDEETVAAVAEVAHRMSYSASVIKDSLHSGESAPVLSSNA